MEPSADLAERSLRSVTEFAIQRGSGPGKPLNALVHNGTRVDETEARVVEAQFRLADGRFVVLASDDEPFQEQLWIILVSADLRVLDLVAVGGAYTPGFLAYAEPQGESEIAFCWHDHDQVVTIGKRQTWLGLRTRWLTVRDMTPQRDPARPRARKGR